MLQSRERLGFALEMAAELEHAFVCQYLFAALALKTHPDEGGITWPQSELVREWKSTLLLLARQEMQHLGQVSNLRAAVGLAPHFRRRAFPIPARGFCEIAIPLELRPLDVRAIRQLIELERVVTQPPARSSRPPLQVPALPIRFDYASPAALYADIRAAFASLDERSLFVGAPKRQVSTADLGTPLGLYDVRIEPVVDRATALASLDQIIEESGIRQPTAASAADDGDGLAGSHYGLLTEILDELRRETIRARRTGQPFAPSRPVVMNPASERRPGDRRVTVIENAASREVFVLFEYAYETLLLLLHRFYWRFDATRPETIALQRTAFWPLMTMVIRPLGEILTQLRAYDDPDRPETCGPGFRQLGALALALDGGAARAIVAERLAWLAAASGRLRLLTEAGQAAPRVVDRLRSLHLDLGRIAANYGRLQAGRKRRT